MLKIYYVILLSEIVIKLGIIFDVINQNLDMKKIFFTCSILVTTFFAKAQDGTVAPPDPNAPVIKWEQTELDYGTIQQGEDGYREFKFTNVGKSDLLINSAHGSCGCTVPTWSKEPVKPGTSSTIRVHYDTNRVGQFTKNVTIISNAQSGTDVLTIKGNVLNPTPVEGAVEVKPMEQPIIYNVPQSNPNPTPSVAEAPKAQEVKVAPTPSPNANEKATDKVKKEKKAKKEKKIKS